MRSNREKQYSGVGANRIKGQRYSPNEQTGNGYFLEKGFAKSLADARPFFNTDCHAQANLKTFVNGFSQ
jgi:hypothetical protein